MANELKFNGHPFSVFGELDDEFFLPDEDSYKNLRHRGEGKGRGRFTQPFIQLENIPSTYPSPEEVLLEKERQ